MRSIRVLSDMSSDTIAGHSAHLVLAAIVQDLDKEITDCRIDMTALSPENAGFATRYASYQAQLFTLQELKSQLENLME